MKFERDFFFNGGNFTAEQCCFVFLSEEWDWWGERGTQFVSIAIGKIAFCNQKPIFVSTGLPSCEKGTSRYVGILSGFSTQLTEEPIFFFHSKQEMKTNTGKKEAKTHFFFHPQ